MNISIDRLRQLGRGKQAAWGAMRAAWDLVVAARNLVKSSERAFEKYKDEAGKMRDNRDDEPFHNAIMVARRDLEKAEEHHERLYEEANHAGRLATEAYNFARKHVAIPGDIEELFN